MPCASLLAPVKLHDAGECHLYFVEKGLGEWGPPPLPTRVAALSKTKASPHPSSHPWADIRQGRVRPPCQSHHLQSSVAQGSPKSAVISV